MVSEGFAVDVPVTNLDVDDDDDEFRIDDDIASTSVDLENLGIFSSDQRSVLSKIGQGFRKMFSRGQNGAGFKYMDNIELFDHGRSRSSSSFADLGDLTTDSRIKKRRLLWKHLFGFMIAAFLATLIGLATLASKSKFSQPSDSKVLKKPLLSNGTTQFYPTTLVISLDGFHPHYISGEVTPFLHQLLTEETSYSAPYMTPTNPSVTFTNHYTLVTGLKPIYHGIISNNFYDSAQNEEFIDTDDSIALNPKWWGGEPVWSTAARHGVSSAVHMWPGSEVKRYDDLNPMYVDKFNKTELLSRKLERICTWLDLPIGKRPELLMSYVPNVDTAGHKYGISGEALKQELKYVDEYLKGIYVNLSERNLLDVVNVIILSDHGMAPTSNGRIIYLDDIVGKENLAKVEYTDGWPMYGIRLYNDSDVERVFKDMKRNYLIDIHKNHYSIHLREEITDEMFGGSDGKYASRIAPIWILPKVGYSIITRAEMNQKGGKYTPLGVHGYSRTEVLMRALFMGTGPFFQTRLGKKNIKLKPFSNTEVYNIICDSLNIEPASNNGTYTSPSYIQLDNILEEGWKDPHQYPDVPFPVEILDVKSTYDLLYSGDVDTDGKWKGTEETEESEDENDSEESETDMEDVNPPETEPVKDGSDESQGSDDDRHGSDDDHHGSESTVWSKLGDIVDDLVDGIGNMIGDVEEAIEPR
ncbi:hypothetical protein FOA43_003383 [Brettanomyces nanus]|uniref:Uncharacterized protein n=1 Tax=Eeniella nana TaxID=13502 RepID=A0A875RW27_EENNA|nr:uncharacterized protein FOA43_003383 [Brettanomyces nanus]QPG75997.1 hypothetical protein FOA43_003383 [Brettanomyces nanus]